MSTKQGKELAEEITADFLRRQEERKVLESKWRLNIAFMLGNQHGKLGPRGEIIETPDGYYWQEKEVYNHIAPIVESRLAKFTRVNCAVSVRPASGDDKDIDVAKLATKLVEATWQDTGFIKLFGKANYWAELAGSVFYKVVWDEDAGNIVREEDGTEVKEGGISISVCPPFEIYPDSLSAPDVDSLTSIIHAKAYPVKTIESVWGKKVEGEDVSIMDVDYGTNSNGALAVRENTRKDYAIVIERYEVPDREHPNGRLSICAGGELLYDGELPYINRPDRKRGLPFIRQIAFEQPACFFGMSVIERLIPVQRAYNAVKNRKHEFMARLSNGILVAEDGSIDLEALEEEGLPPGKVIVYRQGSVPPVLMNSGSVPAEFRDEEERLLSEFRTISGISDFGSVSTSALSSFSGYALSLLIEQDYGKLSVTTESIRSAVKEVARQMLRLYKQYSHGERIVRVGGENGRVEIARFRSSELQGDDVVMESDSEMVETPATRKNMVLELLKYGLLSDENGMISNRNRAKIVEMLGFGNWECSRNDEEVHIKKASLENYDMEIGKEQDVLEFDNHEIHIAEHSAFLVSGKDALSDAVIEKLSAHIRRHRAMMAIEAEAERINYSTNNQ